MPPVVTGPASGGTATGSQVPSSLPPTVTQGPGISAGPTFATPPALAPTPVPQPRNTPPVGVMTTQPLSPSAAAPVVIPSAAGSSLPPVVVPPAGQPTTIVTGPATVTVSPPPESAAPTAAVPPPTPSAPPVGTVTTTPLSPAPSAVPSSPPVVAAPGMPAGFPPQGQPLPPPPTPPTLAATDLEPTSSPTTQTGVPEVSQPMRPVAPETVAETAKKVEAEGIYFNIADDDIREVVKQISRALGKNFLLDDKLRGKVTIISERKMTKDEVWEAFQSALDVLGYTIVDGPAGLLKIVGTRDALSNPIDFYTDKSPFTDRFITRLITLKNISASDMANVIKGLVSKEGNLFAYPVTNTLILTDSGTNIERLIRLINELDQEGPQEVLEIIPILYANAKDLAGKITQIFETDKGSSGSSAAPTPARRPAAAPAAAEIEETPRLRKVIPDDRTNSLIVLASKIAIQKVRQLVRKLDSPLVGDEGEVHVYYLKYANAKDMATVLNALAGTVAKDKGTAGKPGTAATPAAAAAAAATAPLVGGAEFTGKFTVTADEGTNAIVITAGAKDYNTLIDQVISKLDIPRRQVYVEAVIVELTVTENQSLGVGILGGKNFNVGGNNLAVFGSTFGFLDTSKLLSGTLGAANTGQTIDINLPNTGGTGSNTVSVPAFFSALQFVQNNTHANILSTPNILTLDNEEAEIKIGKKVPFPSASATTIGGSLQTTFTREDVALSLKVKPQISEGGAIRMEVTQEDRDILPDQNVALASTAGPTTSERSIKTAIVAENGQTLVLGGLIKDSYSTQVNKIPFLGDIPVLGWLFKQRVKIKDKINLLVFLTPYIIREPKDFLAILNRKIDEQNRFIEANFNKGQQKQIRQQLEAHADNLLKAGAGWAPPTPEPTDEEKYPMELVPPPPAPGEETVPSGSTKSKSKKAEVASETSAAPIEQAPPPPPAAAPDLGEDSDLAIEPKYQKKSKKKTEKQKAAAPAEPAPASTPATSTPGGDIDLAY